VKLSRARIVQVVSLFVVQVIALFIMHTLMSGFQADSLRALVIMALFVGVTKSVLWWVFVEVLSWLPVWLYPILTFVVNGLVVLLVGNRVNGIEITNLGTAIWIAIWLTVLDAIVSNVLSLDEDSRFDRSIRRLVAKRGKPIKTDVPGFLFLEIDGLSEKLLRKGLEQGELPTLKRWIDSGTHQVVGWETDFSAQTGAMQSGILLGNNSDVPAYRWWDREQKRVVITGMPKDAMALEAKLSHGNGLCSDGGSSRGNMFSGDASETMLTFSAIRNKERSRGPGFYTYLGSLYVITRLITRFVTEVIKEWWQAAGQRRQKYKYRVTARNLSYGFMRGFLGPIVQDLVTYTVMSDMQRGLPAIYALYAGYDDLAHFAGMDTPEAFEALHETDRYFARLERALKYAPRPYHIVVLSDHGQSLGLTFENAHGISLENLVKSLVKSDAGVFYSNNHTEGWDNLSSVANEATASESNPRTAGLVKRMLASREHDDTVEIGPQGASAEQVEKGAEKAKVVVFGSGSTGLIYFTDSPKRMTFEQIQDAYPELMIGLYSHPGIGYLVVRSEAQGDIVITKNGVHYLSDDHCEGAVDPLAVYGPNAANHLRRESSFSNCPDIIVNTIYDPATEELCGFENQVSHHGGMGGPQNYPFILRPTVLPYNGKPIVGAESVHHLLRGWREKVQNMKPTVPAAAD
jgi:uncharacterized membrane protein YvlD (DUF360 family)